MKKPGIARRLYLEAEALGYIIQFTTLHKEEMIQSITSRLKGKGMRNFLCSTEDAVRLVIEELIKEKNKCS